MNILSIRETKTLTLGIYDQMKWTPNMGFTDDLREIVLQKYLRSQDEIISLLRPHFVGDIKIKNIDIVDIINMDVKSISDIQQSFIGFLYVVKFHAKIKLEIEVTSMGGGQ